MSQPEARVITQGDHLYVHKDDSVAAVTRYHRRLSISPGTREYGPVHLAVAIDLLDQEAVAGEPEHRSQIAAGLVLSADEARAVIVHIESLLAGREA